MRLIDADAIPYTMLYKENWLAGTGYEAQAVWKEDIDAMPTIEPERKKGKWVPNDEDRFEWHCSECKEEVSLDYNVTPIDARLYFCPNCGADMRGDSDD